MDTTAYLIELYEAISIDEGDPEYLETMVNKKDLAHTHPLFLAVFQGHSDLTKELLDQGSKPELASDENGVTLLHICAERGYTKIA